MKKIVKTFILSALSTLLACSLNVSVMANTTDPAVELESMIFTSETNMGTLTIKFSLFDSDNWTEPTQTFDKIVENVDLSILTDIKVLGEIVEANTPEGYEIMEGKGSTGPSYWLINENTAVAYVYENN